MFVEEFSGSLLIYRLFIVVGSGQGCLWLAIGCHFENWCILILSCIWVGLPPDLYSWRHLVGLGCLVTMTRGMGLVFKVKWTLDLNLIRWTYLLIKPKLIIQLNEHGFNSNFVWLWSNIIYVYTIGIWVKKRTTMEAYIPLN